MTDNHEAKHKCVVTPAIINELQNNNQPEFINGKIDQDGKLSHYRKKTFRNALPQILATCAKNLLLLTYGMTLGITAIAIPALERSHQLSNMTEQERFLRTDIISLTKSEVSWFSSINLICVPLGCFVSGLITQPLGRKRSMMALNIPFFTVWLLYYNATSVNTLYLALAIGGLAGGLHEAPVLTYVAEITEPYLRGMLGSTAPTTVIVGTVSQLILGNFYHWRSVVLFNMFFPIIAFIALSFVPESPHWLIDRGRCEDAEKSLCWLRGWVTPETVQTELVTLKKFIETKRSRKKLTWAESANRYSNRTFVIPYCLIIVTFGVGHFSGMMSLQTNAVKLFDKLGTPTGDAYQSTLILGVMELVGAVVCVVLVHWTGKRKLMITTSASSAVCLMVLAVYAYFHLEKGLMLKDLSWIPIVFLNFNAFLLHAGIRILPWVLIGEMFPTNIRAAATGASALWFYVFAFGANKTFYWMLDTIKVYGLFTLYSTVIAIGAVFFYAFLPETEGLTLEQIEVNFSNTDNVMKMRKVGKMKRNGDLGNDIPMTGVVEVVNKDIESHL